MELRKRVEAFIVAVIAGSLASNLALFWKQEIVSVWCAWVSALVIFALVLWKRVGMREGLPVLIVFCAYTIVVYTGKFFPDFFPHTAFFNAFMWHGREEPHFRFLWGSAQSFALAWVAAPALRDFWKRVGQHIRIREHKQFRMACIFAFLLTFYASVLVVMRHQAFLSTAFDFSIFDQALFQFSRFHAPVSSARQFTNLFLDHQHFAIMLLAPLYWFFRGMHGVLLAGISPFLLILVPSVLFGFAVSELTQKKSLWVIVLSSWILWMHPFTQSSLKFYFHEKYLIPTFFGVAVYMLARFVHRKKQRYLVVAGIMMLLWLLTKEDQWIFIIAACAQLLVHVFLWSRDAFLRKALSIWVAIITALSLVYAGLLHAYASNFNPVYSGMYTHAKEAFANFVHQPNLRTLILDLRLMDDAQKYMYQHFFGIDIIGLVGLPFNIIGNYAERLLSSSPNTQNPAYHYGVDVPLYVAVGVITLVLILQHKQHVWASRIVPFAALVMCGGVLMTAGWNGNYYLNAIPHAVVRDYVQSSERRAAFWEAVQTIPADASVVAAEGYSPQLSARNQIIRWPDEVKLPEGAPGKVDMLEYTYWVLPPTPFLKYDATNYQAQIEFLQTQGYSIITQDEFVVVLKK